MDLPEFSADLEAEDDFGSGGPLELNEANVVAVQDQLKAEIDSLKKWLDQCGEQGAEHSADVVNEVQFACKQSTMLLLEFDEAVRQYQAARREHRSLSPEDVAKFEQFGFIVRAPDGSPIRRSPSRSPAREVNSLVADALRDGLQQARNTSRSTSPTNSSSPERISQASSQRACVKEELEDKQESPEESIKPGSAQLVFDQHSGGRPPLPVRSNHSPEVLGPNLATELANSLSDTADTNGADPRLAGALAELVTAHESLRSENQQLLNVAEGALTEVFRVLEETGSTEESSTNSLERLTAAVQQARSAPATPLRPKSPQRDSMDKSSSLKLEPESELQRQGEELVRLRKREAELQELVSQKDYALARLQDDYDREQMHISSLESELRSRTGSEEDIKKQSDLQQELDKTNALLEASLTRNRTLEEALKESQARETNAISERCQLDEHKHQLLDAVHSIAKDENMLLRSIIEQLKEEIARRAEMYFKDLEATRHELSVAQGYVKPISEEPQITEDQIQQFEEEVTKMHIQSQKEYYVAGEPDDPLEMAVKGIVNKLAEQCTIPIEFQRNSTAPGEYMADQKLQLHIDEHGEVIASFSSGTQPLEIYLYDLYRPFIVDISFQQQGGHGWGPSNLDEAVEQRPKRLGQRIMHSPAYHTSPHGVHYPSRHHSPHHSPDRSPIDVTVDDIISPLSQALSSPNWSLSSGGTYEPPETVYPDTAAGFGELKSPPEAPKIRLSAATPNPPKKRTQQPIKTRPLSASHLSRLPLNVRSKETSQLQSSAQVAERPTTAEEEMRVRALKKLALRKQIEEKRRENEHRRRI